MSTDTNDNIKKKLSDFAVNLEVVLAVTIIIAVVIGLISVLRYLILIFETDTFGTYDILKQFLSYALLLVIGLELVLMLLTHSFSTIVELLIFAIARKMLISSESILDLVFGTLAVAIVFAVRKYLLSLEKSNKAVEEESNS